VNMLFCGILFSGDFILSAERLVTAGRTMVLLVVILPAGCFVSAGSYGLCCWFRVHAGGHTSAGGFISANRLFMLPLHLFMLLNCCAQFDIDGWLVSATNHSVPAGSLQFCWCHNVSAE
ncbi:hypothetical protein Tco_0125030, partial [Tanacetum coccineum]